MPEKFNNSVPDGNISEEKTKIKLGLILDTHLQRSSDLGDERIGTDLIAHRDEVARRIRSKQDSGIDWDILISLSGTTTSESQSAAWWEEKSRWRSKWTDVNPRSNRRSPRHQARKPPSRRDKKTM